MEVTGAWQWRPKAAVTAADSCAVCSVLALQYPDCAVLRVRRSEGSWWAASGSNAEPQVPEDENDIELHGHTDRVTSVRAFFNPSCPSAGVTIVSASRDGVLAWNIDATGRVAQFTLIENPAAEPSCLAFDATGAMIAIAVGASVSVQQVAIHNVFATLEGHIARVTKCEFHTIHHHILLTASEDRTFKIWDLGAKALRFQSAVLSAFAILSMTINPVTGDAAFGFADGSIKIFTLEDEGRFARQLVALDAAAYLRKSISQTQENDIQTETEDSSLPAWARAAPKTDEPTVISNRLGAMRISMDAATPSPDQVEVDSPVLALRYLCVDVDVVNKRFVTAGPSHVARREFNAHGEQDIVDYAQFLIAGLPSCALAINAYSFEISTLHDFQASPGAFENGRPLDPVCVAKDFCFHRPSSQTSQSTRSSSEILCGILSAFQPCFTTIQARTLAARELVSNQTFEAIQSRGEEGVGDCSAMPNTNNSRTSVIPAMPPPKDSVLNLPMMSPISTTTPPKKSALDKPITFRTRIKSSGYGAVVSPVTFVGKRRAPSAKDKARKGSGAPSSISPPRAAIDTYLKEYPTSCGLLSRFQEKNALPPRTLHQGAILSLEFSHDAKWLATSGTDKVAQVCKLPFSRFRGEGNVFAGHDQAVRSIHWSYSNRMLTTTSSDKTTRLWLVDSDTPSLTFDGAAPVSSVAVTAAAMAATSMGVTNSVPVLSSAKKASVAQVIVDALFFYMDRFVVSACGNVVRLHQFELDEQFARASATNNKARSAGRKQQRNDIDVLENRSHKRKVAQWVFDDMQSVTSIACVNGSILSPVVVAAGSDRSLRIVDAGVGKTTRVITDAHARRPVHSLALPRASCYTSHPSNFYDLLASAAANSTVHLWDVRADNCVMRFGEHVNRVHPLGVAFSPCMRYVATGSEDRAAYLYDMRTGRCVTKLTGHTDVVTSVAFNPLHPQLATASYDGSVRFYSDT